MLKTEFNVRRYILMLRLFNIEYSLYSINAISKGIPYFTFSMGN